MATKALPKKIGDAADLVYERQQARLKLQRDQETRLKVLSDLEDAAEEHCKSLMIAQGLESVRGDKATITLQRVDVPKVVDWDKFGAWISKTGDIAVFQKRLSATHFADLKTAKTVPNGVEFIPITKLSISKAAR